MDTNAAAVQAAKRLYEEALWARVAADALAPRGVRRRPVSELVPCTGVLSRRSDVEAAVAEAKALRLPRHPTRAKNWDALGAVSAVAERLGPEARVLDAGSARYSVPLPWLRLYGFRNLLGINLEFTRVSRHGGVVFRPGDITATGLDAGALDALLCLSVIEHGVPVDRFLAEAARVVRPGGLVSLSTDYDQSPPDTTGLTAYGAPVRIFGPRDIEDLVAAAERLGLRLLGDLELQHAERPVHWRRTGLDYTFILLTFERV